MQTLLGGADTPSAPVMVVQAESFAATESLAGKTYRILGYANGETDWSQLSGKNCIMWPLSEPQAAKLAAVGAALRYLPPDRRPEDFGDYDELLVWAKANVQTYESAPQDSGTARPEADEKDSRRFPSDVPQPANAPTDVPEAFLEPHPAIPLSAYQDDAETRPQPPAFDSFRHYLSTRDRPTSLDEWNTPVDFWGQGNLPALIEQYIPASFAPFIFNQSAQIGCDPVQLALNMLCTASAATSEHIGVQVKPGGKWVEKARIWGAVVANPSDKKGPALSRCIAPLREIDRRLAGANNAALEEYEIQQKIHEGRMADYVRESRKNSQAARPPAPDKPAITRLWTDNATKESVAKLLANNPRGRIAVIKDELASWVGSFSAYSAQRGVEKDRGDWLSAYEGIPTYIDRASEGKSIYVPHWSCVIFGGIQPSVISRFALGANGNVGMSEDGMLARFQIVCSRPGQLDDEQCRNDEGAEIRYHRIIENLINLRAEGLVRLDDDAQEYRHDKARWIHEMLNGGLTPALQFTIGKWEGTHMRLALLFHCIDCADANLPVVAPIIPLTTCVRAWRWLEKIIFPHAIHFYTVTLGDAAQRDPFKELANFILARDCEVLTTTELSNNWMKFRDYKPNTPKRRELFDSMAEAGWLKPDGNVSLTSKMPTRFIINPAVHTMFETEKREAKRQRELQAERMPSSWKKRTAGED